MINNERPQHLALRMFMTVDATLLLALGLALIFVPEKTAGAFHFTSLPPTMTYILGLLGCLFLSLGIGYAIAAADPVRHITWIWTGLARSAIETLFGVACVVRGIVTWPQAAFGIIVAAIVAVGYLVLYPRH